MLVWLQLRSCPYPVNLSLDLITRLNGKIEHVIFKWTSPVFRKQHNIHKSTIKLTTPISTICGFYAIMSRLVNLAWCPVGCPASAGLSGAWRILVILLPLGGLKSSPCSQSLSIYAVFHLHQYVHQFLWLTDVFVAETCVQLWIFNIRMSNLKIKRVACWSGTGWSLF